MVTMVTMVIHSVWHIWKLCGCVLLAFSSSSFKSYLDVVNCTLYNRLSTPLWYFPAAKEDLGFLFFLRLCHHQTCMKYPNSSPPLSVSQQNVYFTSSQQLHLGVLSPTIDDDDNKCLVDVNSRPRLLECSYAATKHMKLTWTFSQVKKKENSQTKEGSLHDHIQKAQ